MLAATVLVSCFFDPTGPGVTPTEPDSGYGLLEEIHQRGYTKVDVLFVVDDSPSMAEEQEVLVEQMELMARELIAPTNPEAPKVEDLHLGVVSSNLLFRGVLQVASARPGCAFEESERWLEHSCSRPDDGRDPDNAPLWEDFACRAPLGTGGSSIEQPFEAALMALTDQAGPGMPNEGFLREDSLLAIVFVSDEDDCSLADSAFLDLVDDDAGDHHVACVEKEDLLQLVSRYHDAFLALRGGDLNHIVVAAIAGVPVDGSWNPGDPIEQLRELRQVNPENPNELLRSCDTAMGAAVPPVRMAELVYSFENNGFLESICRSDWTPTLLAITRMIREKLMAVCPGRDIGRYDLRQCRVIETLPDDRPCPHPVDPPGAGRERESGWHVDRGTVEVESFDGQMRTRRRCEVLTADYDLDGNPDDGEECDDWPSEEPVCLPEVVEEECLQGWFFRRHLPDCEFGNVLFTSPVIVGSLSDGRLECSFDYCPQVRRCIEAARSAAPCDSGEEESCDEGGVCVRHVDGEICGWEERPDPLDPSRQLPLECRRCSTTIGDICPFLRDTMPAVVNGAPLVGPGGCCAEGFHCDADRCVPDRTTSCTAGR
jgi:hypothetical protein